MGLWIGAISGSSCVWHICLGQKSFSGLFPCTLDQSLGASEHPSHHLQGPSEAVGVQNSLPIGAMLNEKDTCCRSTAVAKQTLTRNRYTLSVLKCYSPLECSWLQKATSLNLPSGWEWILWSQVGLPCSSVSCLSHWLGKSESSNTCWSSFCQALLSQELASSLVILAFPLWKTISLQDSEI